MTKSKYTGNTLSQRLLKIWLLCLLSPQPPAYGDWRKLPKEGQILLAKSSKKDGIIKQFRKATKLYDDRKFAKAAKIYARILKRFPEHGPSKIQLAKSYYRLEKISTAYSVFKTIDPKYLDPETAYERSQSFYSQKKYKGALEGFEKIPKGHPLYDLAGYFGGISAVKIREYEKADALFEQAVVLPSKLTKPKKLYQKHVEEMLLTLKRKELEQQKTKATVQQQRNPRQGVQTQLPPQPVQPPPPMYPPPAQAYQLPPPLPRAPNKFARQRIDIYRKHKGFLNASSSAEFGASYVSQPSDYSNLKKEDEVFQTSFFRFQTGKLMYLDNNIRRKRRSAATLKASIHAYDRNFDGTQLSIGASADEDIESRVLSKGKGNEKVGTLNLEAAYEFPLRRNFWLGGKASAFTAARDFETGKSLANLRAGVFLGLKNKSFNGSVEINGIQTLDKGQTPIFSRSQEIFDGRFLLIFDTEIQTYGRLEQYNYRDETTDGPDLTIFFESNLVFNVSGIIQAGLGFYFEDFIAYRIHGVDNKDIREFDQRRSGGQLFLRVNPITWLYLEAELLQGQAEFSNILPDDETIEKEIRNMIPDLYSQTSVSAYIQLTF